MKFKAKCTKKDFEKKLRELIPNVNLIYSQVYDETDYINNRVSRLTLYYVGDAHGGADKHVGTWTAGEGWIFEVPKL